MKSNIELLRLVFHFVSPPLSLTSLTVPAGVQGRQIVFPYISLNYAQREKYYFISLLQKDIQIVIDVSHYYLVNRSDLMTL